MQHWGGARVNHRRQQESEGDLVNAVYKSHIRPDHGKSHNMRSEEAAAAAFVIVLPTVSDIVNWVQGKAKLR